MIKVPHVHIRRNMTQHGAVEDLPVVRSSYFRRHAFCGSGLKLHVATEVHSSRE